MKVLLFLSMTWVQQSFAQDSDLVNTAHSLLNKLDSINPDQIRVSDRYISIEQIEKAKLKIKKDLIKSLENFNENDSDPETKTQLFMSNTNASLWWRQLGANDIQAMIVRTIKHRPINKSAIQELNSYYSKWLRKPTIKNLDHYSESLYHLGKSYEILTRLQVKTLLDDGVVVKYQSINSDEVKILEYVNSEIGIEKVISVGNYRIWLEKDEKPITDMSEAYSCVASHQQVTLAKGKQAANN